MPTIEQQFAGKIHNLVTALPTEFVNKLAAALQDAADKEWNQLRAHVINSLPLTPAQEQVEDLLDFWWIHLPSIEAEALALALLTAAQAEAHHRERQTLELVWTGPDSQVIPLRRTDQALLQIVDNASKRLVVVSFAVYKAQTIIQALGRAAQRGVDISICVESADASEGKIAYDALSTLGDSLRFHAQIYIWPRDKRLTSSEGRHGSLHAKVAVADGESLFISSANLTDYAMNLNMEMGVLIRGGTLPKQVERHFHKLIADGVLTLFDEYWKKK